MLYQSKEAAERQLQTWNQQDAITFADFLQGYVGIPPEEVADIATELMMREPD